MCRKKLYSMQQVILKHAKGCTEQISYNMPAYKLNGVLVYFAGYKNHIGFYPTGSGIAAFRDELKKYKGAKGSVQFPIDQPLPLTLIARMVKFRVKENAGTTDAKKQTDVFKNILPAPACRALAGIGVKTLKQLTRYSAADLLELHGMGPSSIPKINAALKKSGMKLKG